MAIKLTARQIQVLELIRDHIAESGLPPTRAEIAQTLGFRSANAAEDHLRALARKGAIELLPGASRGIRLAEAYTDSLTLPVVGQVAAGSPILATEHIEARHQVDPDLFKPRADYLLKVRGLSMRDIGIMDGDLLAVHATPEARNGQIVVARLDDEVTVKRLKRQGSRVWLLPENSEFEPLEIDLRHQSLTIEGLGVGILRTQTK
ncbi:MAG: transcriptional repressor LexA [Proteobacteria bacterium]|nr:transcriptional repressor LexA [Pseudomonadota bacterium]